jgi:hypothetical protein
MGNDAARPPRAVLGARDLPTRDSVRPRLRQVRPQRRGPGRDVHRGRHRGWTRRSEWAGRNCNRRPLDERRPCRPMRRTGAAMLRRRDSMPGRRLLLGRDVRRERRVADERRCLRRRKPHRVRRVRAAVLPEQYLQRQQALLRGRRLSLHGPELRRCTRRVRELRVLHLRRRRTDLLHGRPERPGRGRQLLRDLRRCLRSGDEQVHGVRRQRSALLRRRLVRRKRMLRPERDDVRG